MCTLLSRTTNTTNTSHLEEREGELELQRLEKKDEPGEAASERCGVSMFFFSNQVLSCRVHSHLFFLQHVCSCDMGVLCRSWQAESVDSGCSNSTAFTAACSEGLCAEGICITTGGRCEQTTSKLSTMKVKSAAVTVWSCISTDT